MTDTEDRVRRPSGRIAAIVLLAALVATTASACSHDVAQYSSADDVISALRDHDLDCADVAEQGPSTVVGDSATCTLEHEQIGIFTFADAAALKRWSGFGQVLGGEQVVGPNWVVRTVTIGHAQTVQGALGGTIKRHE
jgi:hypothetical protein